MDVPDPLKNNDLVDKAKAAADKVQDEAARLREQADEQLGKLRSQARDNRGSIEGKLDQAQAFIDEKTKGKQHGAIGKLREFVDKGVDAFVGKEPQHGADESPAADASPAPEPPAGTPSAPTEGGSQPPTA